MTETEIADWELVLSTDCNCETEEGEPAAECWGCFEDDELNAQDLLNSWRKANGNNATDAVRIDGSRLTWQGLNGYKVTNFDDVLNSLKINGDYRITLKLNGKDLTAVRASHDELGASFTFSFVPEELLLV